MKSKNITDDFKWDCDDPLFKVFFGITLSAFIVSVFTIIIIKECLWVV